MSCRRVGSADGTMEVIMPSDMSGECISSADGTMEVIMPSDMSGKRISSADGATEVIMPPRYERRASAAPASMSVAICALPMAARRFISS